MFILLKQFIHELDTEAEVFLAFFIRIVSEEGGAPADSGGGGINRPQWMRVLAMEIIRGCVLSLAISKAVIHGRV